MEKNNIDYRSKVSWLCIYIVLMLVNIAYFPNVIGTPLYSPITGIVAVLCMIFVLLNFEEFSKYFVTPIIFFTIIYLIISFIVVIIFNNDQYFFQSSNFYLTLLCFSMGFLAPDINTKRVFTAIAIFCISACVMGVYSTLRNVGSFSITTIYVILLKNSSGVLLATSSILCMYLCAYSKNKLFGIFWVVVSILSFASLLVFRSRGCIVGVGFCLLVVTLKILFDANNKYNKANLFVLFGIATILICVDLLPIDFVMQSMTENRDVTDFNDFSSGRGDMFERALSIFNQHPLGGTLGTDIVLRSVDNYLINQIGRYGLVGIISNVPIYLFIWFITIKGLIKSEISELYPYLALLILCIVSLTEAPFPFGPGTPCVCAYVLLGFKYNPYFDTEITRI